MKLRNSRRPIGASLAGYSVSAVISYGLPDSAEASPRMSPFRAMRRLSLRPSLELIESFTSPSSTM